jgi:hypothetical protein
MFHIRLLEDSILHLYHTIHKAQGITFPCAVLNIGDDDFAPLADLAYTWPSLEPSLESDR